MQQIIDINDIPELISLTDLRYKTSYLLRKLLEEGKPLLLVKRSKKIAVIYPVIGGIGERKPQDALKIKAYPLDSPQKIERKLLYDDYLDKKIR